MLQFPSADAIAFLNRALDLPASGNEQDWEVELADKSRIAEFLDFYETNELAPEQRFALMSLVLASLDDLATASQLDESLWQRTALLITRDRKLFDHLVEYWANVHCADDGFAISHLVRSIL